MEVPQTDSSGRYYGGQIDLTGDGSPGTVRREGEGVTIYERVRGVKLSKHGLTVDPAQLGRSAYRSNCKNTRLTGCFSISPSQTLWPNSVPFFALPRRMMQES